MIFLKVFHELLGLFQLISMQKLQQDWFVWDHDTYLFRVAYAQIKPYNSTGAASKYIGRLIGDFS